MSALSDLGHYAADRIPLVQGRVYPVRGKQGEDWPTITYQEDSTQAFYCLDQEAGFAEMTATFTAWSTDYSQCEFLVEQLRGTLSAVVDKTIGDTLIDCVLVEDGQSDSFSVLEATDEGVYSKPISFFVRYFRTAAVAPGV